MNTFNTFTYLDSPSRDIILNVNHHFNYLNISSNIDQFV